MTIEELRKGAPPYAVAYRFNNGAVEYLTGNSCLDGSVCSGYVAGEWIEL